MDAAKREPNSRTGRGAADSRVTREQREGADAGGTLIDALQAEAAAAISYGANTLRSVRERYRTAYNEELTHWQALTDEVDSTARRSFDAPVRPTRPGGPTDEPAPQLGATEAAEAAEAGAEDARTKTLRAEVAELGDRLGAHQTELAKLDQALRNLETTWLFLGRGDSSLVLGGDSLPTDIQMRILEAQEAERSRLAQDIHDGPAQVLSNAIFQVEYIEKLIEHDGVQARTELHFLRELLRRELGSVRTFISQLRPPVLDELGLDGAIADAVARITALTELAITTDLRAPSDRLKEAHQTVVLRVVQEALQNVRKHAGASSVIVATVMDGSDWVLTVRDDGRGFDVDAVTARGRLNFGLQFMQERAELINARFEVHSRPDAGTVVRLAIPVGVEEVRS